MEREELRDRIEEALERLYESGYEYVRLYESGYIGLYMDQNTYDMDEGETLIRVSKNDVFDVDLQVALDDYICEVAFQFLDDVAETRDALEEERQEYHAFLEKYGER